MSLTLVFQPHRIPRTTTRGQWREIWRWKRKTERELIKAALERFEMLQVYGTTMPEHIRAREFDKIINPPVMVYPDLP